MKSCSSVGGGSEMAFTCCCCCLGICFVDDDLVVEDFVASAGWTFWIDADSAAGASPLSLFFITFYYSVFVCYFD